MGLVSEITYYVSSETLNHTNSLYVWQKILGGTRYVVQCPISQFLYYKMLDATASPENLFNLTICFK